MTVLLILASGAGVATGVIGALALTRLLPAVVFGVGLRAPLPFASGPVLLLLAGLAATALPCWRAMRVASGGPPRRIATVAQLVAKD